MNRRNFLRGIGLLVGSAMIPKEVLPVTDFIERKSVEPYKTKFPGQFINHMTIQRKSVKITGHAQETFWDYYVGCDPAYASSGEYRYAIMFFDQKGNRTYKELK